MNTLPDNFLWESNRNYVITSVVPGIYNVIIFLILIINIFFFYLIDILWYF